METADLGHVMPKSKCKAWKPRSLCPARCEAGPRRADSRRDTGGERAPEGWWRQRRVAAARQAPLPVTLLSAACQLKPEKHSHERTELGAGPRVRVEDMGLFSCLLLAWGK